MDGQAAAAPAERVVSVDALRGFDMFWITGGREVLMLLSAAVAGGVPGWLEFQLSHVPWEGFAAWDLIMPLFLFVVGVAMPFSFSARTAGGAQGAGIYRKIARRMLLLWILGMIAQGNLLQSVFTLDFSDLHLYSNTLQAIACGYLIAAIALLHLPRWAQGALCAGLLLLFWALMALVPVPGHGAGMLTPDGNLAIYLDKALLGRFQDGTHYTWILSSLTFGATTLLGVFAGQLLRGGRSAPAKLGILIAAGLACLAGGWLWSLAFPIIKHLWTSSMVLWAAGWSYLLLAFFHWLADMRGLRKPVLPFIAVGSNAILAYMLGERVVELCGDAGSYFFGGADRAEWIGAAVGVALLWGGLYALYRKRIFVRV